MFKIYLDMKKMILKDPAANILCLITLILSLVYPGFLHLCINERELFIQLDSIQSFIYALTFCVPMFAFCFVGEIYYSIKYANVAVLRECCILAGGESLLVLCLIALSVYFGYVSRYYIIVIYLVFAAVGIIVTRGFRKKEGSMKAKVFEKETKNMKVDA
ncbi:hypothetical protein [Holdemania massiliensis]|uniref:hypothetical protein n=1 Tax=Holdemania massiliensis TaxID=1468449 RepID=UPI001F068861|nr:hypothetical protein [Holdemania massiliensis]MCH1941392.1 hypothetical protein [Holdemania massiliensis]